MGCYISAGGLLDWPANRYFSVYTKRDANCVKVWVGNQGDLFVKQLLYVVSAFETVERG